MDSTLWESRALERYELLGVDADTLLRSHDLVTSAVGSGWLEDQQRKLDRPNRNIGDVHPLFRKLTSSADVDLVAVCELATYLRTFLSDPALPGIVLDLKSDKFESTFFELAQAHRWAKAGAAVGLQPPVPKGVADFDAVVDGNRFVSEVSVFPADIFPQPRRRLSSVACAAAKSTIRDRLPVAIKINIRALPEGDAEGALHHAVRRACRNLLAKIDEGFLAGITLDEGFCMIEAEPITEMTEPVPGAPGPAGKLGWDVVMKSTKRPRPVNEPLYKIVDTEVEFETLRLFLRLPPTNQRRFETVLKKLLRESRQLHHVASPRVVMLDITAPDPALFSLHDEQLMLGVRKLMIETPELACVWLVTRRWTTAHRFQYNGPCLINAACAQPLPSSFVDRLIWNEGRWDFLTEHQLPETVHYDAYLASDESGVWVGPGDYVATADETIVS